MESPFNFFKKKSVIKVDVLSEQTRDGINKAYIPKFLYKPPFGYPRYSNMGYIRYLATTPYVEMCIQTILDEICSVPWDIVIKEGEEDKYLDEEGNIKPDKKAQIDQIKNFFLNPNTNKETFEEVFIKMPVRDMLEVNSGILNKVYNMKEELVEVVARDGATFTKNPDVHGMYTDRVDILLPSEITESPAEVVNPFQQISAGVVRDKAAYFQYGWVSGPIPVPFGKREIIWLEKMKRTDEIYGYSPVQILAKNLQMLMWMIESDMEYYNDNNVPKGIIGLDGSDSDEIEAFKQQWFNQMRTKDDFGNMKKMVNNVPIVNRMPTFTRIEFSASEMQLIEKQKWYTKMVWSVFGATPVELGYTDEASGQANQIVQSKVFRKKAINPVLRLLETRYNKEIVGEFGFDDIEFKFLMFDIDDERNKYELYKLQTENGIRTINEVRQDEGLEKVDWGDDAPSAWSKSESMTNINNNMGERDVAEENNKESSRANKIPNSENPEVQKPDAEDQVKKKAMESTNPLILKPNEEPTSADRLKKGMDYVLNEQLKEVNELIKCNSPTKKNREFEEKGLKEFILKALSLINFDSLKDLTNKIIRNNFQKGWDQAEKDLDRNFIPDPEAVDFIQSYTFDNIKGMQEDVANGLRQELSRGLMNGEGVTELTARVKKVFDVGNNRAEMIARTETQRAENTGKLLGYKSGGAKGKKEYIAHMDSRTSAMCKRLNGQEVDLDEDFVDPQGNWKGQVPPAHVNCRCTWAFKPEE